MTTNLFDPTNTIVIADFDGTLTKKEVNGSKAAALMAILGDEKYLGKEGVAENQVIFDHYYPIELDPHLDEITKSGLMQEWWEKSYAVLCKYKVTREILIEVCNSPLVQWRDGLVDFIKLLNQKSIPLIVFSAGGFGQLAIEYLLQRDGLLAPNVQILGNKVLFDSAGVMLGPDQPIIHIANKTGDSLIKNHLLVQRPVQRQCLLLGDTLEDVNMIRGLDFDSTYKVAFSSHNLEHFAEKFDLVLPKDGSFEEISDLIS